MSEAAPGTSTGTPTSTSNTGNVGNTGGTQSTSNIGGSSNTGTRTNGAGSPQTHTGKNGISDGTGQTGTGTPSGPQYYEIKVNNKAVKMTLQELMDRASMSQAATERFQRAAELERKYNKFKETAIKDPIQAILDPELGLTKEQIRERLEDYYYNEYVETEKMSPAERDLRAAQQRLKEYEEKETQRQNELNQQEEERISNQFRETAQQQIIEALESNPMLPKGDPFIVSRMAFYMRQNNMNGWDAPMDMIVRQVHSDTKNLVGSICKSMTGEQLMSTLPPEVVSTLLKHHLEKIRKGRNEIQSTQAAPVKTPPKPDRVDMSDVEKRLTLMRTGKLTW